MALAKHPGEEEPTTFHTAMDAPDLYALIRTLARYLRDNPRASDSAEGIRRWWLADGSAVTEEELDKALNWMTQHKLIVETVAADGRIRFRRLATDAQLDAVTCRGNGRMAGAA